jgi:hypothetical protein
MIMDLALAMRRVLRDVHLHRHSRRTVARAYSLPSAAANMKATPHLPASIRGIKFISPIALTHDFALGFKPLRGAMHAWRIGSVDFAAPTRSNLWLGLLYRRHLASGQLLACCWMSGLIDCPSRSAGGGSSITGLQSARAC